MLLECQVDCKLARQFSKHSLLKPTTIYKRSKGRLARTVKLVDQEPRLLVRLKMKVLRFLLNH